MTGEQRSAFGGDLEAGFLAPPGQVADWRGVVLTAAAAEAGLLAALPAEADEAAAHLGLDAHAARIVLDALCEFDVVERDDAGYRRGPSAPDDDTAARLQHHARSLRGWATTLADRLEGAPPAEGRQRTAADLARWLQALGTVARERAAEVAERCLARYGHAQRALDLAGGHGEYGLALADRGLDVTLQDLPQAIDVVAGWPRIAGSSLTLVGCDAFDGLAEGPFDLVVCAGFTHTRPPEANAELLARLGDVTAPGGGIAIVTFLRGRRPVAPLFAVQMLATGGGGDTHGLGDYRAWLAGGGFTAPDVIDLEGGTSILLADRL